jgi:hypothetical protein
MSYVYPSGVATGFSGLADFFALRFSGVSGTPSGIQAPTGTDGFIRAMADAVQGGVGTQLHEDSTLSGTISDTNYADVSGSSFGFRVPMSRYYVINCDILYSRTTAAGYPTFRIVAGSNNGRDWVVDVIGTGFTNALHVSYRVYLSAGDHTIKLQAKVDAVTTTLAFTSAYWLVL